MILYKCLVNGAIAQSAREQVRQGLARIHGQMFGSRPTPSSSSSPEVKPDCGSPAASRRRPDGAGQRAAGTPQQTRWP
jgi:hypothetical protein